MFDHFFSANIQNFLNTSNNKSLFLVFILTITTPCPHSQFHRSPLSPTRDAGLFHLSLFIGFAQSRRDSALASPSSFAPRPFEPARWISVWRRLSQASMALAGVSKAGHLHEIDAFLYAQVKNHCLDEESLKTFCYLYGPRHAPKRGSCSVRYALCSL